MRGKDTHTSKRASVAVDCTEQLYSWYTSRSGIALGERECVRMILPRPRVYHTQPTGSMAPTDDGHGAALEKH